MSAYDFNTDLFNEQFLPPLKRLAKFKAWGSILLKPLQYLHDLFFTSYVEGNNDPSWSALTVYNPYNVVRYTDKAIYECIATTTAGIAPTDTEYWRKIQDTFIGIKERSMYNAQVCVFEYALNKWFGTTFSITPAASEIFIETLTVITNAFVVGLNVTDSSAVYLSGQESKDFVGLTPTSFEQYNFIIYVPTAVFNALGTTLADREAQIRNYADKIKLAGTIYKIETY